MDHGEAWLRATKKWLGNSPTAPAALWMFCGADKCTQEHHLCMGFVLVCRLYIYSRKCFDDVARIRCNTWMVFQFTQGSLICFHLYGVLLWSRKHCQCLLIKLESPNRRLRSTLACRLSKLWADFRNLSPSSYSYSYQLLPTVYSTLPIILWWWWWNCHYFYTLVTMLSCTAGKWVLNVVLWAPKLSWFILSITILHAITSLQALNCMYIGIA